jgi:hypothetical protein
MATQELFNVVQDLKKMANAQDGFPLDEKCI